MVKRPIKNMLVSYRAASSRLHRSLACHTAITLHAALAKQGRSCNSTTLIPAVETLLEKWCCDERSCCRLS